MSLSVEARHCGTIYAVRCNGRIVVGEEAEVLEAAMNRGLREFLRFVLDTGGVSRVDSTGVGLLVRFLSHVRNRGGDLRLSAPPPFLSQLLQVTKLDGIFRVYDSEDEAIVSFLKEPRTEKSDEARVGPMVLFVDQSPDLCAFVRTLLHRHGYEALSTLSLHDAKTLLKSSQFDYIVVGPNSSHHLSDNVVASLKTLAPSAVSVQLQDGFKYESADRAGHELLLQMQKATQS